MKLINSLRINMRKLSAYKLKAIFLILPVILLMTLSIVITSEATNIQTAAESSIFTTISEANRTINLTKTDQNNRFSFGPVGGGATAGGTVSLSGSPTSDMFTQSDLEKVLATSHVQTAQILSALPLSNLKAVDAFDVPFTVNQLAGISSELAAQYTDQSFAYTDGEAIPIIVNANDFIEHYEDWQGKDSISIDFSRQQAPTPGEDPLTENSDFPIKTKAITYTKDDLIGKEFTMDIGGFADQTTYKTEPSSTGITFTKLTQSEIDSAEQTRKDAIDPYWNYPELKKPMSIKFKIVGIISDSSSTYSFIPNDYASKLVHDYINHQVSLRKDASIANTDLDSKFQGLTWDGLELRSSGVAGFGGVGGGTRIRFNRIEAGGARGPISISASSAIDSSANYQIPGLVVEIDRSTNEVKGEYKDANVYTSATHSGTMVLVRVDDVYNRTAVVTALNAAGFAFQDTSKLGVITELKATLNNVVLGMAVGFVIISILVIIFTMGKFVSDSKREIGVFRALGATRGEIRTLFLSQSIMYVLVGYVVGALVGIGAVMALASVILTAFDNFVGKTLKESFAVVNPVGADVFAHVNWEMFAVFSLALLVITIITSLIPATTAANTSPVKAIRGE